MKTCPKCNKQFSDDANFCPVDAARLTTAMAKIVDTDSLSSKFELGDKLGGSRTGAVHRGRDKQSGAAVAIKLVAPAVMVLPGVAQRLERELKQLERVQSAGVAKVLASGKLGDQPWVATELVDSANTLADAITARGPIPLEQAAGLVEVIGEALIEAAQVGVVHRDLAPKNVLFVGDTIKLINFSVPVPVAEFQAPEQADGKPVDQRSNIYSLGALYGYLLSGEPGDAGDAPAPVKALIARALDKSPTKRFLTVRQFVDEVGRVSRAGDIDPKATAAMGKVGKPKAVLVETLLGVKDGIAIARTKTPVPPPKVEITSAPTVGAGIPALEPSSIKAPAISTGTQLGLAGGGEPVSQPLGAPVAAPVIPTATGTQPGPQPQPERSPWQAPVAAEPVIVAAPAPAPAPVVAAPVVPAAPAVAAAAQAAGKKKPADEPKREKGKFRETMWFKKGQLDAEAADADAEERARTGKSSGKDKADSLPIDERYKDDGSIGRADKEKFSLRTGSTQMMPKVDPGGGTARGVSEDALIDEMKGGRTWVFAAIAAAVIGIGVIIFMLAR